MASRYEVNTPLIVTVGVISGLVLLVVVLAVDAWFRYEQDNEIEQKWAQSTNQFLASSVKSQRAVIQVKGFDAKRQTYTVPIDEAMKKIVETGGKLPATRPATTQASR